MLRCATSGLNPLDVTKIRLQNQAEIAKYSGMVSGISTIYREEGFRGLGRGMTASMLREISYSSIRMGKSFLDMRAIATSSEVDAIKCAGFTWQSLNRYY
jgi:hypothetical protein